MKRRRACLLREARERLPIDRRPAESGAHLVLRLWRSMNLALTSFDGLRWRGIHARSLFARALDLPKVRSPSYDREPRLPASRATRFFDRSLARSRPRQTSRLLGETSKCPRHDQRAERAYTSGDRCWPRTNTSTPRHARSCARHRGPAGDWCICDGISRVQLDSGACSRRHHQKRERITAHTGVDSRSRWIGRCGGLAELVCAGLEMNRVVLRKMGSAGITATPAARMRERSGADDV